MNADDFSDCLARVQDLDTNLGLLRQGLTLNARLLKTAEFTVYCAKALRSRGWGLVAQVNGINIDRLAIDRLVHRKTGQVAILVEAMCTRNARAQFDLVPAEMQKFYIDPNNPRAAYEFASQEQKTVNDLCLRITALENILLLQAQTFTPSRVELERAAAHA